MSMIHRFTTMTTRTMNLPMDKAQTDPNHAHLSITQRMGMGTKANMDVVGKSTTRMGGAQNRPITRKKKMMTCGDCTILACLLSYCFHAYMIGVMGNFSYQDRIGAGFSFTSVVCFSLRRLIVVGSIASGGLAMSVCMDYCPWLRGP